MVIINEITEPISELYLGDKLIGKITSHLQLNDCLIQIHKNKLDGYSLLYDGQSFPIRNDGRVIGGARVVYPTFSNQLRELM